MPIKDDIKKETERLDKMIDVCNRSRATLENEYNSKISYLRKEAEEYKKQLTSLKSNFKQTKVYMMKIGCKNCGKYLGEIRDAKLRKEISFFCKECTNIVIKTKAPKNKENEFFDTFFKDIFKGI